MLDNDTEGGETPFAKALPCCTVQRPVRAGSCFPSPPIELVFLSEGPCCVRTVHSCAGFLPAFPFLADTL